jgi:uncharacterized membrane protein
MSTKIRKIVFTALMASLICVATMIIKIPTPLHGYINLGDCVVLAAGWLLSPAYAFLAAGLGSAFADVFSGYATYAPATFVIKGLMALIAFYGFKLLHKKMGNLPSRIIQLVLELRLQTTTILILRQNHLHVVRGTLVHKIHGWGIEGDYALIII